MIILRLLFFIIISYFSNDIQSVIVFLKGASSSGKSTICKEFRKNQNWKVIQEDAIFHEKHPENLAKLFPEDMAIINKAVNSKNLFHAIIHNQIFFKHSVGNNLKLLANQSIQKIRKFINSATPEMALLQESWKNYFINFICTEIDNHTNNGYNVLVETWFLTETIIEDYKKNNKVVLALAYCPLDKLIDRIIKRNDEIKINKEFSSHRFYLHALAGFKNRNFLIPKSIFEKTTDKRYIDTIKLEIVKNSLIKCEKFMVKSNDGDTHNDFTNYCEFNTSSFEKFKKELYEIFGNDSECYIVPKIKFDIVLYSENSPSDSAKKLLDYCIKTK